MFFYSQFMFVVLSYLESTFTPFVPQNMIQVRVSTAANGPNSGFVKKPQNMTINPSRSRFSNLISWNSLFINFFEALL